MKPGWLRAELGAALLRHSLPVAGMLFLGWLPLDVLLFLLIETWLFLTLRVGVETALDRRMGPTPKTLGGVLGQVLVGTMFGGALLAVALGLAAALVALFAVNADDWRQFRDAAVWRTPAFRLGLVALLVEQLWDAGRFAIRIAARPRPSDADDRRLQRVVLRVVFLALAGVAAGVSGAQATGARAVVIDVCAAMAALEAWPEETAAADELAAASAAGAGAAAPRRSRRRRARSPRG